MENQNNKYLTDYNPDDAKWDYHKHATEKVEFYYATSQNFQRYGQRMATCSELLRFMYQDDITTGESKLKLYNAQFCRVRLCPVCQWRRSMAWRARLFQNLPALLEEQGDMNFIFLTLTVKNCPITELSSYLKFMNEGFRRLRDLKPFKKAIKGFLRATEVTKSGDEAHPHFHCILAVSKSYFKSRDYLTTAQWAEMWQQSLRVDYLPVVDARKIRQKGTELESKAIVETLKYTTKIDDLLDDQSWFLELTEQLFKKRFIATGGVFKDILKEEVSETDMLCLSEEDQEQTEQEKQESLKKSLFFGWETSSKKYRKVKNPFAD